MSVEELHRGHLAMVVWILAVRHDEQERKRKDRGYERQRERREMERAVRIRAVALAERLKGAGRPRTEVAPRLGVSAGALSSWRRRWEEDRLASRARGRPLDDLDSELARRITDTLHRLGPFEGLPVLQSLFPDVPRAALGEQLRRYRAKYVQANHVVVHALHWKRVGAVWAMDFAEPPARIDGRYRYILSVRDLGSGNALLSLPLEHADGRSVYDALISLFLEHGVPLVIKCDNGKAFIIQELRDLLTACRAVILFSPPYTPEYNGACEAGIGTLKAYAHHEAARNDRPGEWTCDDVEAARRRANELSRPKGLDGPTPAQTWRERTRIQPEERRAFGDELARRREQCRVQVEKERKEQGKKVTKADRASIERRAVSLALVACGFLLVRRRRISPPIKSKFWSRIR